MNNNITSNINNLEIKRMETYIPPLVAQIIGDNDLSTIDAEYIKNKIMMNFKHSLCVNPSDDNNENTIGFDDAGIEMLSFVVTNIIEIIEKLKRKSCLTEAAIIEELKRRYKKTHGLPELDEPIR